jgi:uncharacterized protein (TIGR03067 family)
MSIYVAQSRARQIRLLGVMFCFTREEVSMRSATFVKTASLLWLAFATPVPAADDKEDDKKSIQGTWVVDPEVYKNVKDKEVVKEMKAVRVVIGDGSFTFKHPPGNEEKGSLRLNPSKKPKEIDLLGEQGEVKAQGIYELEKDSLKLCWDREFKTRGRPTKFAQGKEGNEPFLLVLIREKE